MNTDVSVVIVCMNNLKMLYSCLDSIINHTNKTYEILVVAFFFSKKNLKRLQNDYQQVIIIESNEYRGFAENNNLALRQATGKYCFVVNDDTYFDTPVIDLLIDSIENLSDDVAIISPMTLNTNGTTQRCGKPRYSLFTYFLTQLRLVRFYENHSKYVNKTGVFQTYNISGACFLIKRNIFEKMGWFDERYYFCPEDIALSSKLNEQGYKCFVNADVKLTHIAGGTWSIMLRATKPAQVKGELYFYGDGNPVKEIIFYIISFIFYPMYSCWWLIKYFFKPTDKRRIFYQAYANAIYALLSHKTPKELFIQYYSSLKNKK